MVASSKVPTRVFMSWADMDKDDKNDIHPKCRPTHDAGFAGKAARRVLGEVGVTLYAKIDAKGQYVWQTKPTGDVAGRGLKGIGVVDKVPLYIPQDFQELAEVLHNGVGLTKTSRE